MKKELTRKETEHLISLGVSKELATTYPINEFKDGKPIAVRRFTLADVCALLPKEIVADTIMCDNDICPISIRWDNNCQKWFAGYDLVPRPVGVGVDSELIDALFSTLCWAIDNNHVKLD